MAKRTALPPRRSEVWSSLNCDSRHQLRVRPTSIAARSPIPFVQFRIRRFSLFDLNLRGWIVGLMSVKNAEILRNQLLIIQNVAGIAGELAASGVEDNCM